METKHWYLSKTIWGSVLMLLALIMGQFGLTFTPDEQASAVDLIVGSTDAVLALVGFVLTIVGRIKASTGLTK